MSKCYYCNGVGYCDHCRKKVAVPSPNEVKILRIDTAEKSKPVKKLYGFYSQESVALGQGTAYYSRPDGSLVEISWVVDDPNGGDHGWTDVQECGEVIDWVKVGRPEQEPEYKTPLLKKRRYNIK